MHAHQIGILALQEVRLVAPTAFTKLLSTCDTGDYSYYGEPAVLTEKGHPSGGAGFIVHNDLVSRIRYRGPLQGSAKYRTVWITVSGATPEATLNIGNVYLPDSSIYANHNTRDCFTNALASLGQ